MDSLIVYLNEVPVGRLTDDGGELSFAYDQAYADDARNEPLSHVIPLSNEPFGPEVMEPFLSGLLPEDIIRTRLGRILQIPRENTFAFLEATEMPMARTIPCSITDARLHLHQCTISCRRRSIPRCLRGWR